MVEITLGEVLMSYRSVAVHLAPTTTAFRRLGLARSLAETLGARLIGIAAADPEDFSLAASGMAGVLLEHRAQRFEQSLAALQERYLAAASPLDAQWRSALASPAVFCAEIGRAADLIIVGRAPESEPAAGFRLDAAALLMRAGRPLLLVPPDVDHLSAKSILVAWKGTREARLAVQLALPLLVRADEVRVVGVGGETAQGELDDVCDYLKTHEVAARADWRAGLHQPVAHYLCDLAAESGSDLIVSGGYGQGRVSEWVLGGVTQDLLASSPVCCLMAH